MTDDPAVNKANARPRGRPRTDLETRPQSAFYGPHWLKNNVPFLAGTAWLIEKRHFQHVEPIQARKIALGATRALASYVVNHLREAHEVCERKPMERLGERVRKSDTLALGRAITLDAALPIEDFVRGMEAARYIWWKETPIGTGQIGRRTDFATRAFLLGMTDLWHAFDKLPGVARSRSGESHGPFPKSCADIARAGARTLPASATLVCEADRPVVLSAALGLRSISPIAVAKAMERMKADATKSHRQSPFKPVPDAERGAVPRLLTADEALWRRVGVIVAEVSKISR